MRYPVLYIYQITLFLEKMMSMGRFSALTQANQVIQNIRQFALVVKVTMKILLSWIQLRIY